MLDDRAEGMAGLPPQGGKANSSNSLKGSAIASRTCGMIAAVDFGPKWRSGTRSEKNCEKKCDDRAQRDGCLIQDNAFAGSAGGDRTFSDSSVHRGRWFGNLGATELTKAKDRIPECKGLQNSSLNSAGSSNDACVQFFVK